VLTLVFVWLVRIPAYVFLGLWFVFQLVEANFGLFSTGANGGGCNRSRMTQSTSRPPTPPQRGRP
jgi:hypothetical protein